MSKVKTAYDLERKGRKCLRPHIIHQRLDSLKTMRRIAMVKKHKNHTSLNEPNDINDKLADFFVARFRSYFLP